MSRHKDLHDANTTTAALPRELFAAIDACNFAKCEERLADRQWRRAECRRDIPAYLQVRAGEGTKAYDDLPVVRELRGLANRARLAGKVASRSSDESKKWLSWPDFLKVVQQLRCECAGAIACTPAALELR